MLIKRIKDGFISSFLCTLIIASYLELNSYPSEQFPYLFWLLYVSLFVFPAILIFGTTISYLIDKLSAKLKFNKVINLSLYLISALILAISVGYIIDVELFLVILRPIFLISAIFCAFIYWLTLNFLYIKRRIQLSLRR